MGPLIQPLAISQTIKSIDVRLTLNIEGDGSSACLRGVIDAPDASTMLYIDASLTRILADWVGYQIMKVSLTEYSSRYGRNCLVDI